MKRNRNQDNNRALDAPSKRVRNQKKINNNESGHSWDSWYGGIDPYSIPENDRTNNKHLNKDYPNIDPYMIRGKFKIHGKIGSGAQGRVFIGSKENEMDFAIKVSVEKQLGNSSSVLEEYNLLKHLQENDENIKNGTPEVMTKAKHCDYHMFVMKRFGPSVESEISRITNPLMRANYAANVGLRILSTLKSIHEQGVIHGDVKPENMVVGINNNQPSVYLIDFGLASRFRGENGLWLPQTVGDSFIGTAIYASVSTHFGHTRGPADDLISLGYSVAEMMNNGLPWSTINTTNTASIGTYKKNTPIQRVCKGAASPLIKFFAELQALEWGTMPPYESLERCLKRVLE